MVNSITSIGDVDVSALQETFLRKLPDSGFWHTVVADRRDTLMKTNILRLVLLAALVLMNGVVGAQDDCAAALLPRLTVGSSAMVSFTDGSPLNVRDAATRGGTVLAQIPEGSQFTVIEGPTCADGIYWWRIQAEGAAGWVAESVDRVYLVEPMFQPSSLLEEGTIVAFAGVDALLFANHTLAEVREVRVPGASNYRASSQEVYFMADGHLNAVDSEGNVRAIPTPDLLAIADYWPSPDGSQIAWLLFTETEISNAQDANCGQGIRCVDRDYALVLTDKNGDNARDVWTTRIEDRNNGLFLELQGWRNDQQAIYVFRNPRTPSGSYPVVGDAIFEVLLSTRNTFTTRFDNPAITELAISPDGQWIAHNTSAPYLYLPIVNGLSGINYPVMQPVVTGENLSITTHQYRFSPDSQYFLWVELATLLSDFSAHSVIQRMSLSDGTTQALAQFAPSAPPTMPVAGPWLTDTLLVWYYDEGIHVMDITTGQTAGLYPQIAPMQVGQVVGVLRP
jgi:hypothetical protein